MANAAGSKGSRGAVKPSAQGRAGLRLQRALPGARVLYVSATGATTVTGLAYAGRLGLWGAGETPFENREDFVSAMEAGGVAAMEVVARDLKALGLYQARALSYEGIEVDILEHPLTSRAAAHLRRLRRRLQGHPRQPARRPRGHRHHAGRGDPEQEREIRSALRLRGRQAAVFRPPPDLHEVSLAHPRRGERPGRRPLGRDPVGLHGRGPDGTTYCPRSRPPNGTTSRST